jgi:hypothetical protein
MFYIIVLIYYCLFCQFFEKRLTKILFFRFKNEETANLLGNIIKTKNAPNFFRALNYEL